MSGVLPSDVLAGMFAQAVLSAELTAPAQTSFTADIGGGFVRALLETEAVFWGSWLMARTRYDQLEVTSPGEPLRLIRLSGRSSRLVGRALARRYRLCQAFAKNKDKYEQELEALALVERKLLR